MRTCPRAVPGWLGTKFACKPLIKRVIQKCPRVPMSPAIREGNDTLSHVPADPPFYVFSLEDTK